jgi:hypothetical protein
MMKCKEASQLISRNLDQPLSMRERLALKFHLIICKYCYRFSQQLQKLHVAIHNLSKSIEDDTNITLPSETKKRIVASLKSED